MVQRDLHYAIVDEVDSILIDEARTPLIISGPADESTEHYYRFAQLVPAAEAGRALHRRRKSKPVALTEEGVAKVEKMLGVENLYDDENFRADPPPEPGAQGAQLFQRDRTTWSRTAKSSSSTSSPAG